MKIEDAASSFFLRHGATMVAWLIWTSPKKTNWCRFQEER
jgi:hypothetical protein